MGADISVLTWAAAPPPHITPSAPARVQEAVGSSARDPGDPPAKRPQSDAWMSAVIRLPTCLETSPPRRPQLSGAALAWPQMLSTSSPTPPGRDSAADRAPPGLPPAPGRTGGSRLNSRECPRDGPDTQPDTVPSPAVSAWLGSPRVSSTQQTTCQHEEVPKSARDAPWARAAAPPPSHSGLLHTQRPVIPAWARSSPRAKVP